MWTLSVDGRVGDRHAVRRLDDLHGRWGELCDVGGCLGQIGLPATLLVGQRDGLFLAPRREQVT